MEKTAKIISVDLRGWITAKDSAGKTYDIAPAQNHIENPAPGSIIIVRYVSRLSSGLWHAFPAVKEEDVRRRTPMVTMKTLIEGKLDEAKELSLTTAGKNAAQSAHARR